MGHQCNGTSHLLKSRKFSNSTEHKCSSQCYFKGKLLRNLTKHTVCKHKVPLLFHEPYVIRGYRKVGMPWLYYLSSIFKLHNESVNIWSHILASILVFRKFQKFSTELDFYNDPFTWPLLAGILSSFILFLFSCSAHCLQSRSNLVHYMAFMLDYAGIGLYALGSTVMFLEYCSSAEFYNFAKNFFVFVGIPLSCAACAGCCLSKILYDRPYPLARKLWQILPVGGAYFLLISPVVHRLYLCNFHGTCSQTYRSHICHIVWFGISAFFFACQLPQSRLSVGACDHFFHSHQLFHFAIMISILIQLDAIYEDFLTPQTNVRLRSEPTLLSAFGPTIFVLCFELVSLVIFYFVVKRKLTKKPCRK